MQMQDTVRTLSPAARYEALNRALGGSLVATLPAGNDNLHLSKYSDILAGHIDARYGALCCLVSPDGTVARAELQNGSGTRISQPIEQGTRVLDSLIGRLRI